MLDCSQTYCILAYCMGEGRFGPPLTLDTTHFADRKYANKPMIIGTDTGATCDATCDIVNTRPRGAVLTTESLEAWHWWKMQMNERRAKMSPKRAIRIPLAIRQVFRATRFCEARSCAAMSDDGRPSCC